MKRGKAGPGRWRVWPKEKKERKIAATPMAERVKLVRCKDCRFLENAGCYGECGRGHLGVVRPDDFCSREEKRE